MIEINKLYGILRGAADITGTYQWYSKNYTTCKTSDKIDAILAVILKTVPLERRAMFACLVCAAVVKTIFGKEITELDPVNTYMPVTRPPSSNNADENFCLWQLAGPADAYKSLRQYLDEDIIKRMTTPTWMEYIAAGCLQILRELRK